MTDQHNRPANPGDSHQLAGQCKALRKDGDRCRARAVAGGELCTFHSVPDEERRLRSVRGGQARSNRARAAKALEEAGQDFASLRNLLFAALRDVRSGSLEPSRASAMSGLARAILSVSEAGELEERLAAVEAKLERIQS